MPSNQGGQQQDGFDNEQPVKVAISDASTDENAYGWLDDEYNAECPSRKM